MGKIGEGMLGHLVWHLAVLQLTFSRLKVTVTHCQSFQSRALVCRLTSCDGNRDAVTSEY